MQSLGWNFSLDQLDPLAQRLNEAGFVVSFEYQRTISGRTNQISLVIQRRSIPLDEFLSRISEQLYTFSQAVCFGLFDMVEKGATLSRKLDLLYEEIKRFLELEKLFKQIGKELLD
jgi:hypothetical protein